MDEETKAWEVCHFSRVTYKVAPLGFEPRQPGSRAPQLVNYNQAVYEAQGKR